MKESGTSFDGKGHCRKCATCGGKRSACVYSTLLYSTLLDPTLLYSYLNLSYRPAWRVIIIIIKSVRAER